MKIQIVRTDKTTRITRSNTPSGGGQSIREEVLKATTTHSSWVGEWKDSKPISRAVEKELKDEMMRLASEAGLI